MFGERPSDKRQEAGSQPSERQGRQPAEKILRGKRQGKAKQAKPSRQGKSKARLLASLSFCCFQAASRQPSSREAASSRPSDKQGRQQAERQASQQQADKPASASVCKCAGAGVLVVCSHVRIVFLNARQTWTDLPDESQFLNARKSWTEFGVWIPLSICRKSRPERPHEMCGSATVAKSSAIGIADGHEKCRHLAEPTARP